MTTSLSNPVEPEVIADEAYPDDNIPTNHYDPEEDVFGLMVFVVIVALVIGGLAGYAIGSPSNNFVSRPNVYAHQKDVGAVTVLGKIDGSVILKRPNGEVFTMQFTNTTPLFLGGKYSSLIYRDVAPDKAYFDRATLDQTNDNSQSRTAGSN